MRTLFTALSLGMATSIAVAGVSHAQSSPETVIQSQLDAFKIDDFEQAFTFASPFIQRMFGTPERFGAMVKSGYPMVWRPDTVAFLSREEVGATVKQRVMITDVGGAFHILEYEMVNLQDLWKINGVRILSAGGMGA